MFRWLAERRLGEMLMAAPKNKGVRLAGKDALGGSVVEPPNDDVPTLADIGIDKKVSALLAP